MTQENETKIEFPDQRTWRDDSEVLPNGQNLSIGSDHLLCISIVYFGGKSADEK